jgi:uncharacterized Zn finger protein (UPF0148 family)
MLTASQCRVVCFALDGQVLCPKCAAAATSQLTLDKAEKGLTTAYEISAWIEYSASDYASENAWEYASQEYDEGTPEFQELYERLADNLPCESCGENVL